MISKLGFSAWITVDGATLPEYLVAEDEDAHRVSCWIPGEEGQGTTYREGVRTSKTTERPFMFKKVEETEPELASASKPGKEVGMVVLRIKRVKREEAKPANTFQPLPEPIPAKSRVGSLEVGFGEERITYEQYSKTWSVRPHSDDEASDSAKPTTYISFVFRYRTREFLESQGIVMEPRKAIDPHQRIPVRRVASLPLPMPSPVPSSVASPIPTKKRPTLDKHTVFLNMEPHHLQTREARRAVSCRIVPTKKEGSPESPPPYDDGSLEHFTVVKRTDGSSTSILYPSNLGR
ncbi:hypothetical protein BD779DRAFT_1468188 [Infundibulicybe gibba]|nr:hypothetical protein BD779DRAFT_1468188 [Infundibulicybe gibba]